jgi:hypothetical protein
VGDNRFEHSRHLDPYTLNYQRLKMLERIADAVDDGFVNTCDSHLTEVMIDLKTLLEDVEIEMIRRSVELEMSEKPSNKPSQSILWPINYWRVIIILESVNEVLHRIVMARGIPTNVGITNAGKKCIVIVGHKEVQDHKIELLAGDTVYTCVADSKGRLSSIGLQNVGKDVTVLLHLKLHEEDKKGTEQEEMLKKLKDDLAEKQEQINQLAKQIKELEK